MIGFDTHEIIREYVVFNNIQTGDEYDSLTESAQMETVKTIVTELMKTIKNNLRTVNLSKIDKTKGEIRQLDFLDELQTTINTLKDLYETDVSDTAIKAKEILDTVVESIKFLNKYSKEYKEAYRLKKSVLIMQYETIVVAIIQTISYLVSMSVDFSSINGIDLSRMVELVKEIPAVKSLKQFTSFAKNDNLKLLMESVNFVRDYYVEDSPRELLTLTEASDILTRVSNGFNNFINKLSDGSSSLNSVIYKAAVILTILYSIRDIIYSLTSSSISFNDCIGNIKTFAGLITNKIKAKPSMLDSIKNFNRKVANDSEFNIVLTDDKVEDSNREIKQAVKQAVNNTSEILTPNNKAESKEDSELLSTFGF